MSDRVTQVVLGIFAGIFSYCLIVLRTIRGGDEGEFVPGLSVALSVALAIGGIGTLIFFIHHIASSIQASSILASVAAETLKAVDRLFPGKLGHGLTEGDAPAYLPPLPERKWQAIRVHENGYIQSVDNAALLRVARGQKAIVRMERGVGEFVVDGTPLVSLAQDGKLNKEVIDELKAAFSIDRHRTVEQDAAFGIRQIVDIALRALSPGINDSTTAAMCVDYLTAILARVASLPIPSSHRFEDGELRVIAIGPDFASFVAGSFDEIRRSAAGNVAIMLRMLDAFQTIGSLTDHTDRRRILREQASCIAGVGLPSIPSMHDRARFDERLTQVLLSLGDQQVPPPHKEPQ